MDTAIRLAMRVIVQTLARSDAEKFLVVEFLEKAAEGSDLQGRDGDAAELRLLASEIDRDWRDRRDRMVKPKL